MTTMEKFVLFPLGGKRFALPATEVRELARPDRLQAFPHESRLFTGVLLRRRRVIPVCDVAQVLLQEQAPPRKFYLIAGRGAERTAIPVSGECELIECEQLPRTGRLPEYVSGLLALEQEIVEVLDLGTLAGQEAGA